VLTDARATPPSHRSAHLARSVALGALIGAVNVAQIWVLLPALAQVPGVVAFPVSAAGGLALATLGGWVFWREPLAGRTGAGIVLAMLAASLANAR
jgi:multidrug transporter EmrE-like cation transporter